MNVLENVVGWLAPPQCASCLVEGSVLCDACIAAEIIPFGERCWRCGALSPRGKTCVRCVGLTPPGFVWISTVYEKTARELIKIYKFGHLRAAHQVIASIMAETFLQMNSDEHIRQLNYLVVPVPTATSRRRQRGFGHAELLAEAVSKKLRLDNCPALQRIGQQRQVGAQRSVRLSQSEGSYVIRRKNRVSGRNVLLVDDVITTGATLHSAAALLRKSGARHINALVFAKRL